MSSTICRVCLASNVRMHRVDFNNGLQEMFEKVTSTKLRPDGRPVTICYICLSLLQKSHRFSDMCQRAEILFTDLITNGIEITKTVIDKHNQETIQYMSLSVIPTQFVLLNDVTINKKNQVPVVKDEFYEGDQNENSDYIVKCEIMSMDEEHFQTEESTLSHNSNSIDSHNNKKQLYDNEENAVIDDIVKDEMIEIDDSISLNNTDNIDSHNKEQNAVIDDNDDIGKNKLVKDLKHSQTEDNVNLCNTKLKRSLGLVKHLTQHAHTQKPYPCKRCDKTFSQSGSLLRHMSVHTGENPYLCNRCDKTFTNSIILKQHMSVHTGEKPYSCNRCDKTFSVKRYLKQHMSVHTGQKPYSCNRCDKTFSLSGSLLRHISVHTEQKPYSCNICKRTFTNKRNLKQHLRIHTGEKPYSCNRCNKNFTHGSTLRKHMYVHTSEKRYSCNICQKTFQFRNNLKQHMRVHTGEKPYSCNRCDKTFSQTGSLRRHMRIHTGEKPYSCNICDKTFSDWSTLQKHFKTHCKVVMSYT